MIKVNECFSCPCFILPFSFFLNATYSDPCSNQVLKMLVSTFHNKVIYEASKN